MRNHFHTFIRSTAVTLPLACLVAACGGGKGGGDQLGSGTSATTSPPSDSAPPPPPTGASSPETALPSPSGGTLPSIVVEHLATTEQSNTPLTFGQVFAAGDLSSESSLSAVRSDGSAVPLQIDVKATHADGSVRHAVLSGIVPRLAAAETRTLSLVRGQAAPSGTPVTPQALLASGFKAALSIELDGQTYRASADELLHGGQYTTWLSGPIVSEWLVSAPLKTAAGAAHPHLSARFAVRAYAGTDKARVEVIVENNWAYEPGPQNFTYDTQLLVGGSPVYSQTALTHFHHARWRKTFWWGAEPQLHLRHDSAYLRASKAVPNYDPSLTISAAALTELGNRWSAASKGPMGSGLLVTYMPTTGGRPDIGPLPQWSATYVISMDRRAKDSVLGSGDLAGSWPIHYRDKLTGLPVSLKDFPYMTIAGRPSDTVNPATKKSEAFPACGGTCTTAPYNYQADTAHQPSLAFLPYLVTGDHFYLEELQFWANYNVLNANPHYRLLSKGVVKNEQVRGQAWSLRTLGQAAYITPDNHPLKGYFTEIVGHNIDWYNTAYTTASPNQFGVLDGSSGSFASTGYTTPSGPGTGLAPWQDDFFTWSTGHLVELGFSDAVPLRAWKAKFPVGRMTAPGYCWIDGATYALAVRPSGTSPLYTSFAEAYQATMRGTDGTGAAIPLVNSTGARYLDQTCGSQAQADWRTRADLDAKTRRGPWLAGEMTGYSTSPAGYPSNMQPALAAAVDAGIPQAQEAWATFMNRSAKPDYRSAPQWAIVPRP